MENREESVNTDMYKNKTNHLMLSNSHPMADTNKSRHLLKKGRERGYNTERDFDKFCSGAPGCRF